MNRALSRKFAYRKSVLRNLATSLILYEQIKTTEAKAKEVKPVVEQLISKAKKNNLEARRYLLGYLFDTNATKKVFEVLVPRYQKVNSGYLKSYKLNARLGDGARMMILKFVPESIPELEGKTSQKGQNAKENHQNGQEVSQTRKKIVKTDAKIK